MLLPVEAERGRPLSGIFVQGHVELKSTGTGQKEKFKLRLRVSRAGWPWAVTQLFFFFFRVAPVSHGDSQARGQIGAATAGLHHSHSNSGSESHLQPTPPLVATSDPLTH